MKTVSVCIPCYNEEENVMAISEEIIKIFQEKLPDYNYELVFIDNDSRDNTKKLLRQICRDNKNVKAIFNAKNFGQFKSPYYGILQTIGDCTIIMSCDFQDPVEMIPIMVEEWEKGNKIIAMQKTISEESKLIHFFRSCYYKLIKKFSDVEQIEHFTGFGLYDSSFVEVLRELKDPTPFLRGIVAELGYKIKIVQFSKPKRRAGKTHNNFYSLYDGAMLSITSYTKIGLRICTFFGMFVGIMSVLIAMGYLIAKLIWWDIFVAGMAPILIGMFFLGALQLFFIGFIGEYILSINQRVMNRPLVIEEERINFD